MKPRWMTQHAKDKSEPDIVEALLEAGFQVWDALPCDLLTWRTDKGWLPLECKTPYYKNGNRRYRNDQVSQENFLKLTGCPVVLTPLDALRAVGATNGRGAI